MKTISQASNLIITGMPLSGKTTVSKLLAESLEMNLIDLDSEIEKEAGMKISDIFDKFGEAYFRTLEKNILKRALTATNSVISTGGGIVKDAENIELMHKGGVVFFLNAPIETLCGRIKNDNSRPLLACQNQKERLKILYEERINLYRTADFEIDTAKDTEKIIEEIKSKLKGQQGLPDFNR